MAHVPRAAEGPHCGCVRGGVEGLPAGTEGAPELYGSGARPLLLALVSGPLGKGPEETKNGARKGASGHVEVVSG